MAAGLGPEEGGPGPREGGGAFSVVSHMWTEAEPTNCVMIFQDSGPNRDAIASSHPYLQNPLLRPLSLHRLLPGVRGAPPKPA